MFERLNIFRRVKELEEKDSPDGYDFRAIKARLETLERDKLDGLKVCQECGIVYRPGGVGGIKPLPITRVHVGAGIGIFPNGCGPAPEPVKPKHSYHDNTCPRCLPEKEERDRAESFARQHPEEVNEMAEVCAETRDEEARLASREKREEEVSVLAEAIGRALADSGVTGFDDILRERVPEIFKALESAHQNQEELTKVVGSINKTLANLKERHISLERKVSGQGG